MDLQAVKQASKLWYIILTEWCFDVAKLVEAGIYNAVASFGAGISGWQIEKLLMLFESVWSKEVLVWFDRDKAGRVGSEKAWRLLKENWIDVRVFDWDRKFKSSQRQGVWFPSNIKDVCDFSVEQLGWLRGRGCV